MCELTSKNCLKLAVHLDHRTCAFSKNSIQIQKLTVYAIIRTIPNCSYEKWMTDNNTASEFWENQELLYTSINPVLIAVFILISYHWHKFSLKVLASYS